MTRRVLTRECGGCTACCYVIKVEQLSKPFRSVCPFVVIGQGCGIWGGPGGPGGQPEVCAKYRCAWLSGYGDEEDRPDVSGILVDRRDLGLAAIGVREGYEKTPKARLAMERISRDAGELVTLTDRMLEPVEVIEWQS